MVLVQLTAKKLLTYIHCRCKSKVAIWIADQSDYFLTSLLYRIIKQNCFNGILRTSCWCILNECTRRYCSAEKNSTQHLKRANTQLHKLTNAANLHAWASQSTKSRLGSWTGRLCPATSQQHTTVLEAGWTKNAGASSHRSRAVLHWIRHLHCPHAASLVYSPALCRCPRMKESDQDAPASTCTDCRPSQQWLHKDVSPRRPFVKDSQPCTIDTDSVAVWHIVWTPLSDYYELNSELEFKSINKTSNFQT